MTQLRLSTCRNPDGRVGERQRARAGPTLKKSREGRTRGEYPRRLMQGNSDATCRRDPARQAPD